MSRTTDTAKATSVKSRTGIPREEHLDTSNFPYFHPYSRFALEDKEPRRLELIAAYTTPVEKDEKVDLEKIPLTITLVEAVGLNRYDDRYHFNGRRLECQCHEWRHLRTNGIGRIWFEDGTPFEKEGNNTQKLLNYGQLIMEMIEENIERYGPIDPKLKKHPVIKALRTNTLRKDPPCQFPVELKGVYDEKSTLTGASFENNGTYIFPLKGPDSRKRDLVLRMVKSRGDEEDTFSMLASPLTIVLTEVFKDPETGGRVVCEDTYVFDHYGGPILHKYNWSSPTGSDSGESGDFTKLLDYAPPISKMIGKERALDHTLDSHPVVKALKNQTLNQLQIF